MYNKNSNSEQNKKSAPIWKGMLLPFIIAIPAWIIGRTFPVVGAPVVAILLGFIIAFIPRSSDLSPGISFTSKKVLQYAIILLGFDMNLFNIIKVGQESLIIIITTISTALIAAYIAGRFLKLPSKTTILIGVGSSICGGSAIAATSPVIAAEEEDVASAISTIFLFNVIAALVFPYLGQALAMTDSGFGIWAGTAVNDTSSVVAAATTWSNAVGNDTALTLATIVKLTRTMAIIPITFVLALYRARKEKNQGDTSYSIRKIFPYFILFFLLAAVFNTFAKLPSTFTSSLVTAGKFMITMAMAAIGLNTNLMKLLKNGIAPILLGLICWISVALSSLLVQYLSGLL